MGKARWRALPKFIVANDLHYQGSPPRARQDDYQAAIEAKIREVFQIAQRENARAILVAGDLFNTPGVSIPTFINFYRLLKESPCEILAIHGSPDHDGLAASIDRTWYQVLVDTKVIQDVERLPQIDDNIVITGTGANPETDHGINDYMPDKTIEEHLDRTEGRYGFIHIHLAHGMLLERPPGTDFFRYTLLEDVAAQENAPDVLICGHYHPGWGIKKLGRTLFINPGAIARTSASPVEFERPVQAAILTVENGVADARLVPLQSAQPGHIVLSRAHLDAEAARAAKTAEYMGILNNAAEFKALELTEIVEMIDGREHFGSDVRAEALTRIAAARERGRGRDGREKSDTAQGRQMGH
jgi:exonuclease SbcD